MIVMFCGHNDVAQMQAVRSWLCETVEQLIQDGASKFYLGGYGGFDRLVKSVMLEKKKSYPSLEIVLVLPYLNSRIDTSDYDYTVYPPLENVPPRFAISRRNLWTVEEADIVVAYVTHDWGGAAMTLRHAVKKRKMILCYPNEK